MGRRTVPVMDEISGIPAHPLFVHIPVVLLPLATLLALVMLVKQSWFERYKWALLGVVGAGTLGAILAAGSGEELEEAGERGRDIHDHAEAGEMARNISFLFFLVVLAWIFVPTLLKRRAASSGGQGATPGWFRIAVAAAVAVVGIGTSVAVVDAGHSGAKQVWNEDEDEEDEGEHEGDDESHDEGDESDEDGAPVIVVDHVVGAENAG